MKGVLGISLSEPASERASERESTARAGCQRWLETREGRLLAVGSMQGGIEFRANPTRCHGTVKSMDGR